MTTTTSPDNWTVRDTIELRRQKLISGGYSVSELGELGDECTTPLYGLMNLSQVFVDGKTAKSYRRAPRAKLRFPIEAGEVSIGITYKHVSDLDAWWSEDTYRLTVSRFDDSGSLAVEWRGAFDAFDHLVYLTLAITRPGVDEKAERDRTPTILPQLIDLAEKIKAEDFSFIKGRHRSRCAFCGRSLTDDRSRVMGYGPDCAANFRLLWGEDCEVVDTDPTQRN